MNNITNRVAIFKTVIAIAAPDGIIGIGEGIVKGYITTEELGESGFGYDPIFEVEGLEKTYAQMTDYEKNIYSHRAFAIKNVIHILMNIYK